MEIRLSDRIVDVLVGLLVFALLFNLAFSIQRDNQGLLLVPVWLMLLDICLVAKHMRDQKLLLLGLLLAVAYFTEWTRNAPKDGDTLETFKFVFYTGILYGSPLLYFCTSLFTQLDFIRLEATKLTSEVDRLKLESGRLEMSSSALSKPAGPGADKTMSNYDLYSRCLSELVHMRTVKDVPGFLFRNLSSGMNMQRGAIAVINEGTTQVIQAWGIPGDKGPSEIEVPDELIRMVQEKGGAVLEKEITGPGLHHEAVEWFAESAFEPVGMFPLTVRGKVLFLVFAGTSAEMGKALKVMPTLAITDITSQYVERFLRL